jgi:thiol-disulfide isomerase/thioredoxin
VPVRTSTRWTFVVLAVAAAIVAALLAELRPDPAAPPRTGIPDFGAQSPGQSPQALEEPRRRADLPPCPAGDAPPVPGLRGVVVQCAADGSAVDMARVPARGRPLVLNLWAYWCGPCADELPAMAEYQRRSGPDVEVLTVHQDPNEAAGLLRLAELGVRLPTVQDADRRIAAALAVPNVMPATVVLRPDGTVAGIMPRAFDNADDIAAAVRDSLR